MSPSRTIVDSEEEIDRLQVRLRPILGIAPRIYVPILWGLVLTALLFALLVLPGLLAYGTEYTVVSAPAGAEVLVDGQRRGVTPITPFIAAGDRTVEVRLGAASHVASRRVGGRLVGSLFVPRRERLSVALRELSGDSRRVVDAAIADFAAWSLVGRPSAQFQQPPVATDAARSIWAAAAEPEHHRLGRHLLRSLVSHAQPWQARDIMGAAVRVEARGGAPGPAAFQRAVQSFIHLENESPSLFAVAESLASDAPTIAQALRATEWLQLRRDAASTALLVASVALDEGRPPRPQIIREGGLSFVRVPEGAYILGYPLRDERTTGRVVEFPEAFFLAADEISNLEFARFVDENPNWAPEAADRLADQGLVEGDYLAEWPPDWRSWLTGRAPDEALLPVRFVPWHAAEAYAGWISERVATQARWDGWTVRLPTAAELEYAAFLDSLGAPDVVASGGGPVATGSGRAGALGARHLVGNLWEWSATWHGVNGKVLEPAMGDQRVVVGGAFSASAAISAGLQSVEPTHSSLGSQPPEWATPYLGFRVALVRESPDG